MKYITVIGLEVHAELKTKSKAFCSCSTEFGAEPNTHVCPVCLGMPGALPVVNRQVVEFAIRAGLALNCDIQKFNKFDRKNYFYPDLAKNYQISQWEEPICLGGHIDINVDGNEKRVGITRIHMEEDAGKLVHSGATISTSDSSAVDYNRAGVPLIEIVSEPDMRSAKEARAYMENLKAILEYTDVCDCKMQEGSLRCDANISIMPEGAKEFGTRAEIKNLNSFRALERAIEYEVQRQQEVLEDGGHVVQETRTWDDAKGITLSMRSKEEAHDYRYFREPDLVTINVTKDEVEKIKESLPELPADKLKRYVNDYQIPEKDTALLTKYRNIAEYFDKASKGLKTPKTASNFIIGQMFRTLETEIEKEAFAVKTTPEQLFELCKLIEDGKLKLSMPRFKIPEIRISPRYAEMLREQEANPDKSRKEATTFVKQKMDMAKWFVEALKQRHNTLEKTMNAILEYQYDYFVDGDEAHLKPMVLKDIAQRTGFDISTISRVVNSKYIETHFGIFPLKYFFSEGLENSEGEEVSTRELKKALQECIDAEDKKKPLTDEQLVVEMSKRGYKVARRTIAKYRDVDYIVDYSKNHKLKATAVNPYLSSIGSNPIPESKSIADLVSRPDVELSELLSFVPRGTNFSSSIIESAEIELKYSGYIQRERQAAEKMHRLENLAIPDNFDFTKIHGLTIECRQKLAKYNPRTIAQAGRISGVSPADISVLLVYFGR